MERKKMVEIIGACWISESLCDRRMPKLSHLSDRIKPHFRQGVQHNEPVRASGLWSDWRETAELCLARTSVLLPPPKNLRRRTTGSVWKHKHIYIALIITKLSDDKILYFQRNHRNPSLGLLLTLEEERTGWLSRKGIVEARSRRREGSVRVRLWRGVSGGTRGAVLSMWTIIDHVIMGKE